MVLSRFVYKDEIWHIQLYVQKNILNSFFEGAKSDGHCGRNNGQTQYGRQSLFDFVITS